MIYQMCRAMIVAMIQTFLSSSFYILQKTISVKFSATLVLLYDGRVYTLSLFRTAMSIRELKLSTLLLLIQTFPEAHRQCNGNPHASPTRRYRHFLVPRYKM